VALVVVLVVQVTGFCWRNVFDYDYYYTDPRLRGSRSDQVGDHQQAIILCTKSPEQNDSIEEDSNYHALLL
jgi:hypothetical protein